MTGRPQDSHFTILNECPQIFRTSPVSSRRADEIPAGVPTELDSVAKSQIVVTDAPTRIRAGPTKGWSASNRRPADGCARGGYNGLALRRRLRLEVMLL